MSDAPLMGKTVWYISKYFAPPQPGETGGRGFLLLKEFISQGVDTYVITSDSNNLVSLPELSANVVFTETDGLKIVWLKTIKYGLAKSVKRIVSWLHFEWNLLRMDTSALPKPDAIIVSSLSLLTILNGLRLKRRYRCRLIFEIRDIWPLTITEEGGFSKRNPFVKLLAAVERFGYAHSDAIVGTMPNLGQHVTKVLGREKPVYCIPMGIEADTKTRVSGEVSQEYVAQYLPENKFVVMYAGTIGITNALETFFSCARSMESDPSVHFVLLGDGALKDEYKRQYASLKNLTFAPRVPKNQVQSALRRAGLLYFSVYPSKVWDYGQSLNKVVDYMLSGKPIVASYSGYPSMIDEAGCGTFVPAGDVEALVQEIQYYKQLSSYDLETVGFRGKTWLAANRNYPKLASDYLQILFPSRHINTSG